MRYAGLGLTAQGRQYTCSTVAALQTPDLNENEPVAESHDMHGRATLGLTARRRQYTCSTVADLQMWD